MSLISALERISAPLPWSRSSNKQEVPIGSGNYLRSPVDMRNIEISHDLTPHIPETCVSSIF